MRRNGFALIAVLWMLTAVTALTGVAVAAARIGGAVTRNRVVLARAGWAREACVGILAAWYARDPAIRHLGVVELGRGTWCQATLEDPSAKLNVNLADRTALAAVLANIVPSWAVDSLVEAVVGWRHRAENGAFANVAELADVPGFTDSLAERCAMLLTTRGTGAINVNLAPPEVLATLPGLGAEAVRLIGRWREQAPVSSGDALAGMLSPGARATLLANYGEFGRLATFTPPELVAVVTGGVRGTILVARTTLTVVPVGGRLAVTRRETE